MQSTDLSGDPQLVEGRKGEQILEGLLSPDNQTLVFRSPSLQHPHDIWCRRLTGDTRAICSRPDPPASTHHGSHLTATGWRTGRTGTGRARPTWSLSPRGGSLSSHVRRRHCADVVSKRQANLLREREQDLRGIGGDGANLRRPLSPRIVRGWAVQPASPVHAPLDLAPDGKHLLLVRPMQAEHGLVVVHIWKHELRALARGGGK